jgi:hypothetical protein
VTLDLARAHAARIHGDHLVTETRQTAPYLADQHRVEAGFPIARNAGGLDLVACAVD